MGKVLILTVCPSCFTRYAFLWRLVLQTLGPISPLLIYRGKQFMLGFRLSLLLGCLRVHFTDHFGKIFGVCPSYLKDHFGLNIGKYSSKPG